MSKPTLIDSNPEMGTRAKAIMVGMTELEYAWAAGFIEADGCIHLTRSQNCRVQVVVVQKELMPIQRLQRIFDDHSAIGIVTRRGGTATYFRVSFSSQRGVDVLKKILPYLEHKRAIAELALELAERRIAYDRDKTVSRGHGKRIDPSELRAREAIIDRARDLTGQAERLSEPAPQRTH